MSYSYILYSFYMQYMLIKKVLSTATPLQVQIFMNYLCKLEFTIYYNTELYPPPTKKELDAR
jgi:hypothetical protein